MAGFARDPGAPKRTNMNTHLQGGEARAEKRHAFEKWYAGWDAFMQDRPDTLPADAGWPPADRDLFHQGHAAATLAAERFRREPLDPA